MTVKINLSGHANPELERLGFLFPGAIQVDLADPELAQKLVNFLRPHISSADVVIVALPGLAPLAALTVAVIHGLSGTFPTIQPLIRGESGFVPGPCQDLQELRNSVARQSRVGIVNL